MCVCVCFIYFLCDCFQVKGQTDQRKTPVSQPQTTCSSQFIPIHHPGAFPPLPSRPGTHTRTQQPDTHLDTPILYTPEHTYLIHTWTHPPDTHLDKPF